MTEHDTVQRDVEAAFAPEGALAQVVPGFAARSQQIEMAALFPQDENESEILPYVTYDPIHIDEITRNSGLDIPTVSGALAMMELKGLVRQVGGMNYIRLKEASAQYQAV